MMSSNGYSLTVSPVTFVFFFTFQDVAGNSLGLLPPSFSAAIVDSGKCRCKNRFSEIFAETVREYLRLKSYTREHAKHFHVRYQHKLMSCCLVTSVLKRRWLRHSGNQFLKIRVLFDLFHGVFFSIGTTDILLQPEIYAAVIAQLKEVIRNKDLLKSLTVLNIIFLEKSSYFKSI